MIPSYFGALIAGVLSVLGFAPFNLPGVLAFSLLCLFYLLSSLNFNRTFLVSFIYGVGYFGSQLYWVFNSLYSIIHTGLPLAIIATILFVVYLAFYIVAALMIFKLLETKSTVYNYLFLLPSLWTIFEWLRSFLFTGFSWCEIGYSLVNNSLFRGVYPLLGNYGVSFLFLNLAGVVYLAITGKLKTWFRFIIIYLLVALLGLNYLNAKKYTLDYGPPSKVALIQGDESPQSKWDSTGPLILYRQLLSNARADIILFPETAIASFARDLPIGYLDSLRQIARAKSAALIVGILKIIDDKNNYVNAAELLTSSKDLFYAKSHLVPYGEYIPLKNLLSSIYLKVNLPMVNFSSGSLNQMPLPVGRQKLAVNICYENGFNSELINAAKSATLMVNLSDMMWYGNSTAKDEHLQISQARALENGRYFIQVTNSGLTAVINDKGQIQSQLKPYTRAILTDYAQGKIGAAPFQRFGNTPIITFTLLLIILGLLLIPAQGISSILKQRPGRWKRIDLQNFRTWADNYISKNWKNHF